MLGPFFILRSFSVAAERIEPICRPLQRLWGQVRVALDHRPGEPSPEPLQLVRWRSRLAMPGGEGMSQIVPVKVFDAGPF